MHAGFIIIRKGCSPLLSLVSTLRYSWAISVKFYSLPDRDARDYSFNSTLPYCSGIARHLFFGNAKITVIELALYGTKKYCWLTKIQKITGKRDFISKVCIPYCAKAKVEHFYHYFKSSSDNPLTITRSRQILRCFSLLSMPILMID